MVRPTPCFPHFPSSLAFWNSLRRHWWLFKSKLI
jgi:hypothetical protein